jgi:hypothetical protein
MKNKLGSDKKSLFESYKKRSETFTLSAAQYQHKANRNSLYRLLTFICIPLSIYFLFAQSLLVIICFQLPLLALFIFLVKKHNKLTFQRDFNKALANINHNESEAILGNYEAFSGGNEFIDKEHTFSYDLDLFGEDSFYKMLNRTSLHHAGILLADKLKNPILEPNEILQQQESIKELAAMMDFRHEFTALGQLYKPEQNTKSKLIGWLQKEIDIAQSPLYKALLILTPFYSIGLLSAMLLSLISPIQFFLFILVPLGISGANALLLTPIFSEAISMAACIKQYQKLLLHIEKQKFTSSILQNHHAQLKQQNQSASDSIADLEKIIDNIDNRYSGLGYLVLNAFFLWDIKCIRDLAQWKKTQARLTPIQLNIVDNIDVLISLSNFCANEKSFSFPTISPTTIFEAEALGHPFIDENERICNTFNLQQMGQLSILTGANMAGKSTFLRSIGLSLVMAGCGLPVCAKSFSYTPIPLFTSMRTTDSLSKHESYFFTELKRLKQIIDILAQGKPLFIILDEILKGTNSLDKERGSAMFVRKLLKLNAVGVVATHDLSLCTLENDFPQHISNYSFEIEINGSEMLFDYTLKKAICQKMNASILMEKLGLV